ncbi:MAG: hypothetical protein AB1938_14425 [Myxococcota bacterium]
MSKSALSLEALFGDLNLDLEPALPADLAQQLARPQPEPEPSAFSDAEATLDALGFTPASALLSDADARTRATQPYDLTHGEWAQNVSMWGDDERFSSISTTPVTLDDLPEDAYPTQFTLLELE